MSLLVLNAGSSTLKFALFARDAGGDPFLSGVVDWAGGSGAAHLEVSGEGGISRRDLTVAGHGDAARALFEHLAAAGPSAASGAAGVVAVGHRIVHGGAHFRAPVAVDDAVEARLRDLSAVAPLHNPPALAVLAAARRAAPAVPHVAVFDTAFFADLPPVAYLYPLPWSWYERYGVRRYGFHGISHAWAAARAAELLGRAELRLVSCHLGNGCSAAAVRAGRAVATTMGLTPLEGLMMGSRCGSVDPGALIHVQRLAGMSAADLDHALNHDSGLLGVSGVSSDYRQVAAAAAAGHQRAALALALYEGRIAAAVGALATEVGGLDALLFTAGVGEHAAGLRQRVCARLAFLGVRLDPDRNTACQPDADVAADGAAVRILVVRSREDLMIARQAARFVPG